MDTLTNALSSLAEWIAEAPTEVVYAAAILAGFALVHATTPGPRRPRRR